MATGCDSGSGGSSDDDVEPQNTDPSGEAPTDSDVLFNGLVSMDLEGFTTVWESAFDSELIDTQQILYIGDRGSMRCGWANSIFPSDFDEQFVIDNLIQNTINSGADAVSINGIEIDSVEGTEFVYTIPSNTFTAAAKEFLFYFNAAEISFGEPLLVDVFCLSDIALYSELEPSMDLILNSLEFEYETVTENVSSVPRHSTDSIDSSSMGKLLPGGLLQHNP